MVGNAKKGQNVSKQIDALKESLLAEFKEQLAALLAGLTIAGGNVSTTSAAKPITADDLIFIPSQITCDTDTELSVDEKESSKDSLDEAAEALRKIRKEQTAGD